MNEIYFLKSFKLNDFMSVMSVTATLTRSGQIICKFVS